MSVRLVCLLSALWLGAAEPAHREPAAALAQAHQETWKRFVDEHGVVRDYVGELPTPEDCRLGRPNAIGWGSPIENGPMFTGMYLDAMVTKARRSGAAAAG